MLNIYPIATLLLEGKQKLRSLLTSVGTETGSDFGLILDVAARMLQGAQVAAAHIVDQSLTSTADASTLERLQELHAIDLQKDATTARGLLIFEGQLLGVPVPADSVVPAGTEITFAASETPDGVERTYTLLQDVTFGNAVPWVTATLDLSGTNSWRARISGVARGLVEAGQCIAGPAAIRRWDPYSGVVEFYSSPPWFNPWSAVPPYPTVSMSASVGRVVEAECTVAGKVGNMGGVASTSVDLGVVTIAQMGGGADEDPAIDPEDERNRRMLDDEIASGAGLGNMQHVRELVLSCPDIALDDAVVYRGIRGPSTIDVVAIGKSQRVELAGAPLVRTEHVDGWLNGRLIGDVQARRLRDYLLGEGEYSERLVSFFDDIEVHQLDYDRTGQDAVFDQFKSTDWARSVCDVEIVVEPQSGFGVDSGADISDTHDTTAEYSNDKIYAQPGFALDARIEVGHRVVVDAMDPLTSDSRRGYVSYVGTVQSIAADRSFAALDIDTTPVAQIMRWRTAGPLTQPIITAAFDYFDDLGPGSYLVAPKDPGYTRSFPWTPAINIAPDPGVSVDRWPTEGRDWRSGYRISELVERIKAIEGVRSVAIDVNDFDPLPLRRLWFRGVTVRYA